MGNDFVRIWRILDDIKYKRGWALRIGRSQGRPYLQWSFDAPCAKEPGGPSVTQWARKWWLSYHMTEGELVQTAFAAALAAEEHECREFFSYAGDHLFNPHIDINCLRIASRQLEVRK